MTKQTTNSKQHLWSSRMNGSQPVDVNLLITIGEKLPNGYEVIGMAGQYVAATNDLQYCTWWTYVREDGLLVTVEGNYFIPEHLGGHDAARAKCLENLDRRFEKCTRGA